MEVPQKEPPSATSGVTAFLTKIGKGIISCYVFQMLIIFTQRVRTKTERMGSVSYNLFQITSCSVVKQVKVLYLLRKNGECVKTRRSKLLLQKELLLQ